jgi:hypothetical protein
VTVTGVTRLSEVTSLVGNAAVDHISFAPTAALSQDFTSFNRK